MQKKILLIEDDELLGDLLHQKLEAAGYAVTLARDGAEGWNTISMLHPDLILLDLILPTMNGYEILEARQKDETAASIPVIVVSNSGQPIEINRILSLGVKDYLVKAQLEPDEVIAKVKNVFGSPSSGKGKELRLSGRKVLWVEDDQFLRDLMKAKLEREGCVSIYAENGARALELLKGDIPDVILLDLVLPDMTGFEILKTIKEDPRMKRVPVIVLSNIGQQSDIEKTKALGAAKHLIKAERDPDDIMREIADTIATNA